MPINNSISNTRGIYENYKVNNKIIFINQQIKLLRGRLINKQYQTNMLYLADQAMSCDLHLPDIVNKNEFVQEPVTDNEE